MHKVPIITRERDNCICRAKTNWLLFGKWEKKENRSNSAQRGKDTVCTVFIVSPLGLNRSHSYSVHVGRMDDCLWLPGQDGAVLGPAGAKLRPGCRSNSARLR